MIDAHDVRRRRPHVQVTNKDATAVSEVELLDGERIVGEKENLPPGLHGSSRSPSPAGSYTLYCPGATTEQQHASRSPARRGRRPTSPSPRCCSRPAPAYASYVDTQVGYLRQPPPRRSTPRCRAPTSRAAQNAYKKARPYYEKIEPVAESFTVGSTQNLDADIDARAGDVPADAVDAASTASRRACSRPRAWPGSAPYGDGLVANVHEAADADQRPDLPAAELANGAQDLLDEVARRKITGEEERYSHIDLLDFADNVEGAEQAFADAAAGAGQDRPGARRPIADAFAALDNLRRQVPHARTDPSGFVLVHAR